MSSPMSDQPSKPASKQPSQLPERPQSRPELLLAQVLGALLLLVVLLLVFKPTFAPDPALVDAGERESLVQGPAAIPTATTDLQGFDKALAEAGDEPPPDDDAPTTSDPLLEAVSKRFVGDLDALRERGFIRVLVTYNRTSFFLTGADEGQIGIEARGFEHDAMEQYKTFLNRKTSRRRPHLQMVYVPVPFDHLLDALARGEGDVIAAGMTVTPSRAKQVAFTKPYLTGVSEVLVTHAGVQGIASLGDLSGRRVRVLRGSSYARHLRSLSEELQQRDLAPILVEEVAANLQTEDMLELVNSGALDLTVADEHLAKLWAGVLPNLKVRSDIAINEGGELAWAVRKGNPKLLKSLNRFADGHKKGTLVGNILFERFYRDTHWIKNPVSKAQRRKLKKLSKLFKKYAEQYGFDWLSIAAQAFQESGLEHKARSHKGAVGIMQVRAATAKDKHVGIPNIHKLEDNIHAGVKYLAFLRDHYFSTDDIDPQDRVYFSLAAYNAGPTNVIRMRNRARRMGLNPNRWFGQVELAALRQVGRETVRYVRNIVKYSTAYKLSEATEQRRREQRKKLGGRG